MKIHLSRAESTRVWVDQQREADDELAFTNRELETQFAAIEWLKKRWGYIEVKSGEEKDALGSPIDSVGLMDGRILLIEVKDGIDASTVRSIEAKIAQTLKGLHEGRKDKI